jgi:hypothetical protein
LRERREEWRRAVWQSFATWVIERIKTFHGS